MPVERGLGERSAQWRRCRRSTPTGTSCRCRPGTAFPRSKYRLLRERVATLADLDASEAAPASDDDLARVHDPGVRRGGRRRGRSAPPSSARSAFPGARRWSSARGARSARPSPRRAPRSPKASPPTSPAARTTRRPRAAAATASSTTSPSRRGVLQAEAPLPRRRRRPRRPPGRRHRGDLRRRRERVHALAARREELPVPQGRERPRRRAARRLRRRRLPGGARRTRSAALCRRARERSRSASPSTSPAPTRTKATGSAGSS